MLSCIIYITFNLLKDLSFRKFDYHTIVLLSKHTVFGIPKEYELVQDHNAEYVIAFLHMCIDMK